MNSSKKQPRINALGVLLLCMAPIGVLGASGFADSTPGSLDTLAPTPGVASPPATAQDTPIEITYSGATDGDGSGLTSVELWVRTDTAPWAFSGLAESDPDGSFSFTPAGDPGEVDDDYYFTLVAEDNVGNRSEEPEGLLGEGDGTTTLDTTSHVADWMVLDQ